jgi:vacuolar-type H+-ATPase subunit E/Vma4
MGLHAILEAIRSSGDASVAEIESRAYVQARQILANARLETDRLKEQACATALEPAFHERARLIHRARLEAMQITGGARKELVDAAIEQARGRLAGFRSDASYPQVLHQLLLEALSELNGSEQGMSEARSEGTIGLEADPDDRVLLERILQTLDLSLAVSYPLHCWGGLVAKSEGGRIVVINTLEARLERAIPYLRRYLAAFFEDEDLDAGPNGRVEHQMVMKG